MLNKPLSSRCGIALLCLCALLVAAAPARPQVGAFTTIDVPGAGSGVLQGTFAISINAAGTIAGIYVVSPNVAHGFVRAANGTITPFDAPGAGAGSTQGTFPLSINAAGEIVGMYADANNLYHGFVRAANGAITSVEAPGAATAGHNGTNFMGINTAGVISGFYRDASAVYHGFSRAASGAITPFEAPGAGASAYAGTEPLAINTAGAISGMFVESYSPHATVYHGFVRAANGAITAFDPPGAGSGTGGYRGTFPISINTAGAIAGAYSDSTGTHGFVRAANGAITPFDAPGASATGPLLPGTGATSINDAGLITGGFSDSNGVMHGFVRATDGTVTPFDAPGAGGAGTSLFPGTMGTSINDSGYIAGAYADGSGAFHGFLLKLAVPHQTQVINLQNIVQAFIAAGTLSPGQGQFLLAPLNAALAALDPRPAGAAIRELNEFITRVRFLVILRQLTDSEGSILIDTAESLISALRG